MKGLPAVLCCLFLSGPIWSAADGNTELLLDRIKAVRKEGAGNSDVLDDVILATPAIAGGCVFLRSNQYVYCVSGNQERSKSAGVTITPQVR